MQPLSIKTRICINITIMIVVIVTIISSVAYTEFKEAVVRGLDDKLRADVGAANIFLSSYASETVISSNIHSVLSSEADKRRVGYGVWFEGQNDYIACSDSFDELFRLLKSKKNTDSNNKSMYFHNISFEGRYYRGVWANYTKTLHAFPGDKNINIVVFISRQNAWHEISEYVRVLLITCLIAVGIIFCLIMYILKWGLSPIHSITDQMEDTSGNNLFHLKFKDSELPKEIKPFVIAWNQLIVRLSKVMNQQKQFTADASHELRTPLAVIKSTLQISRFKTRSTVFYQSTIDKCLSEMSRMENLIDQLLELARFDEGISKQYWHNTNLENLIVAACDKHSETASQKKQSINTNGIFPFSIDCNSDHLIRAFSNLIENAVKYGPANSDIVVEMQLIDDNIAINFKDAGGGIPADECDSIFDRFYRADKARNQKSGGAGLGLAITKEIIVRHGGSIKVISNLNDGTVFTITLPTNTTNSPPPPRR